MVNRPTTRQTTPAPHKPTSSSGSNAASQSSRVHIWLSARVIPAVAQASLRLAGSRAARASLASQPLRIAVGETVILLALPRRLY